MNAPRTLAQVYAPRTLAQVCPGMDPNRLAAVTGFLKTQFELDKQMSPGMVAFLAWLGTTGAFWGGVGWWIRQEYPPLDQDDPDGHRSRSICIASIVYFSLNILIILLYSWLIHKFRAAGWDDLHPNETYSGKNPTLTWGIMGLFTMGGLFTSIIFLCHYAGHDLHPALIVLLSLIALIMAITIALAGKVFVNCTQPKLKLTAQEQSCVPQYLIEQEQQFIAEQQALADIGRRAERNIASRKGIETPTLIEETSRGTGVATAAATREVAAQTAAKTATDTATRAAAATRGVLQSLVTAAAAVSPP